MSGLWLSAEQVSALEMAWKVILKPFFQMFSTILTPSGYPPTGKGLGALICVWNMPNDFGYQMYVTYELTHVSAKLVRYRAFEMDLLTWKQVHEAKDEDQTQETRKAGKQRTEAAQHASRETGQKEGRAWEAGKQDGREASKQETAKEGSREAGKGKQGSREAGKQGSREVEQRG